MIISRNPLKGTNQNQCIGLNLKQYLSDFSPKHFFKFILFSFLVFSHLIINGQEVNLFGTIQDSSGITLPNANVIAFPDNPDSKTRFTISNDNGQYSLSLEQSVDYTVEVSYLGFVKQSLKLKISDNQQQDFFLIQEIEKLDEVELTYRIPVIVKRDTIVYNVEAFVNGKERKVRELLKKLPGIEVDRDGNVTAQGERITKVLVDGDIFFTGDSKLAVNNIPAGVVDQIEILDNYNQIAFLKGLQDTDDKALNIKLKDDRKKFAFGELEIGAGVQDRYLIHPTLFYYSPKTNINIIGDFNNIGQKSFTYDDYVNFEGGISKLIFDAPNKFNRRVNSDISNFLEDENVVFSTNRLGALNIKHYLSEKVNVSSYFIVNDNNSSTLAQTNNQFLENDFPINEIRIARDSLENFFSLGKLTIDYKPNEKESLQFNTFLKISNNSKLGELTSTTDSNIDFFNTTNRLNSFSLRPNFSYNKKFSLAQTLSINLDWSIEKSEINSSWINNNTFLTDFLPLMDSNLILIEQLKNNNVTNLEFSIKDYWVINSFNHIYTTLGYNVRNESFESNANQIVDEETPLSFGLNGFENNIDYKFQDLLLGLEYKFLLKNIVTKIGVFAHNYQWNNEQEDNITRNEINTILPQLKSEYRFNSGESIVFQYKREIGFPKSNQVSNNLVINSFNSIYSGNQGLQNELSNNYSLNYRKFNLLKGLSINAIFNYRQLEQSIKNATVLSGIEQLNSPFIFNLPENSITAIFSLSKRRNSIKYTIRANANYNEFFQIVNTNTDLNISRSLSSLLKLESYFEKIPNFELSYKYSPTRYSTNFSTFKFVQNTFQGNFNYNIKDFKIQFEYDKILFANQNNGTKSDFDVANASMSYQKEDSPWYFEVKTSNLFNTQFQRRSAITDFLISDEQTFIIPRIVLAKVSYKL